MKRVLKIFRVLLLLVAVLAVAGLVFWTFIVPGIVAAEARQALAELGFRSVELELRGLSTSHATVSRISIGEDRRLTAGSVDVDFDIEGLGALRIRTVRVTRAVLVVRYGDGGIDLGPLSDIDAGESDGDGELPFDAVELEASTILLERDGVTDRIPIDGTLANTGGGSLRADIRTRLFGRDLRIRGDVMSVAEKLRAEITSSAGAARVEYDWSGARDRLRVALHVEESDVDFVAGGLRIQADRLSATGGFSLVGFEDVTRADLEIRAAGVSAGGTGIGAVTLRAQRTVTGNDLYLKAKGTRRTGSDGGTTLRVSVQAAPSVAALLDPDTPRRFRLHLSGDVPAEVVDLIREAGLEPGAPFKASAAGEGVFRWNSGDFEAALALEDLRIRAGGDPLRPRLLLETFLPGQVAYDASGSFRLRLPRLWTEVVTPEVLAFVDPGLLAAAGLHVEATGGRIEANFEYETDDHLVFGTGDFVARSAWLRLAGKAVVENGALIALDSRAKVTADWLRAAGAGLSVRGIEAAFPLSHGPVEPSEGRLATGEIVWEGIRFPGIRGSFHARADGVEFVARWPVTEEGWVDARGSLGLAGGEAAGKVHVESNPIPIGAEDRLGRLLTGLTGLSFGGKLEVGGDFPVGSAAGGPRVRATLTEGRVSVPDGKNRLEGVSLSVELDSFSPMRTPGGQRLRFEGGKLGEFLLGGGEIAFRVEGPEKLVIEEARWELGRTAARLGRFWARPFRLDPGNLEIDTTLFCEGFDLADWLSLVAPEGTTGSGILYGRLPFVLKTNPKLSATLGEGYLFAESGGWLGVKGTKEYVKQHIPATGPSAEYTEVVQRRIVHALENFNFEKLRFDLIRKDDGLTLRVGVMGRGAEVLEGTVGKQELDLTLNFNGVDSLIGPALDASLGIKELSRMLERSWKGGRR